MIKLAVFGCQHLGYRASGTNRTINGINIREQDGYTAHQLTMQACLDEGVDGIIDGGDLFHVEHPTNRAVNQALSVDNRRVEAGVWRFTNGGNHDNGASTHISAVSHIHRTHLDSHAVFPSADKTSADTVGPHPGLYEVHQPIDGLCLHIISHNGLDPNLEKRGITIDPQPVAGAVNLLFCHGIFSADGRLFGADERHGALRVIPEDWADRGFDQLLLSDYHTPGPIPGFGPEDREVGQVWMTGSAVRRGFSDEESPRGWLLATIDNGKVTVELKTIWQRPQVDFPVIDARNHTVEEIDVTVRTRLANQPMWDAESAELTGDGGYILRQCISHTTAHQRRGLAAARKQWAKAAQTAASWTLSYTYPETTTPADSPDTPQAADGKPEAPRTRNLEKVFNERKDRGHLAACLAAINSTDPKVGAAVVNNVTETLAGVNVTG